MAFNGNFESGNLLGFHKVNLNEYNQLDLQNCPMLVTGFVTQAAPGTIFYYYQKN